MPAAGVVLLITVVAIVLVLVFYLVSTIVALARRIAGQARTAVEAVEALDTQTVALDGIGRINDSGVRILHSARALRKVAVGK